MAGHAVRMFGRGPDRKVSGIYFQRRFLLAGAHAARPRHPCRRWTIEIRDRKIVGARAAGAARHGDDGLMMAGFVVQVVIARSAATKQSSLVRCFWIASLALAMTVTSV